MAKSAAKEGDKIKGTEIYLEILGLVPGPVPRSYEGKIKDGLSKNVNIKGKAAVIVGGVSAKSTKSSHSAPQGGVSVIIPRPHRAKAKKGSKQVKINGKAAIRDGDKATIEGDLGETTGTIKASGSVKIGG